MSVAFGMFCTSKYATYVHGVLCGFHFSCAIFTCGGGDPVTAHFNDICGPGWTFCSMNVYIISGTMSANREGPNKHRIKIIMPTENLCLNDIFIFVVIINSFQWAHVCWQFHSKNKKLPRYWLLLLAHFAAQVTIIWNSSESEMIVPIGPSIGKEIADKTRLVKPLSGTFYLHLYLCICILYTRICTHSYVTYFLL